VSEDKDLRTNFSFRAMKMFVPVFLEVVLRVEGEDESWHRVLSAFFGPRRAFADKLMVL
jgi:hypothetical protein